MRAKKYHFPILIICGLFCLQLTGCATSVGSNITASEANLAKFGMLSKDEAISALGDRINEAKNAHMPFLAPNYFREAFEILESSKKSSKKQSRDDLISEIAKADALLDKGQSMMKTVQDSLANLLEQKGFLDKYNGSAIYPKEYEKSIKKLSSIIEKIESEETDGVEDDKAELLKNMQALFVKTVQYATLHESELINENTQSNDGEKLAPATLAEAIRVYEDAMNRIAQAPHDEEAVKRAGEDALFAARHAHNVSGRVLALQLQFNESVEQIVLDEEKLLLDIATALGHKDPRDLPLEKQAEKLAKFANEIARSNSRPSDDNANGQQQGLLKPSDSEVKSAPLPPVSASPSTDIQSTEVQDSKEVPDEQTQ